MGTYGSSNGGGWPPPYRDPGESEPVASRAPGRRRDPAAGPRGGDTDDLRGGDNPGYIRNARAARRREDPEPERRRGRRSAPDDERYPRRRDDSDVPIGRRTPPGARHPDEGGWPGYGTPPRGPQGPHPMPPAPAERRGGRTPTASPPYPGPTRQRQPTGGPRTAATGRGPLPTMQPPARGQTKLMKMGLASLAVFLVLMVCGYGGWAIMQDEQAGKNASAEPTAPPTELPRDISSREVDPAALTVAEVFPTKQIAIDPSGPPYRLIGTHSSKDCRIAADGQIRTLLARLGCSQVIRGTIKSPTNDYLVTGGIFNLSTDVAAKEAYDAVKQIVDARKGRFKGYVANTATKPLALSSTHLGWDFQGHYLVYCVIARVDGKEFAEGDPFAKQILYDIIELHLLGKVVHNRATIKIDPSASTSPAATPS